MTHAEFKKSYGGLRSLFTQGQRRSDKFGKFDISGETGMFGIYNAVSHNVIAKVNPTTKVMFIRPNTKYRTVLETIAEKAGLKYAKSENLNRHRDVGRRQENQIWTNYVAMPQSKAINQLWEKMQKHNLETAKFRMDLGSRSDRRHDVLVAISGNLPRQLRQQSLLKSEMSETRYTDLVFLNPQYVKPVETKSTTISETAPSTQASTTGAATSSTFSSSLSQADVMRAMDSLQQAPAYAVDYSEEILSRMMRDSAPGSVWHIPRMQSVELASNPSGTFGVDVDELSPWDLIDEDLNDLPF